MIYTEKVNQFLKQESNLEGYLASIHALAWGQCSEAMKAFLKTFDQYQSKTHFTQLLTKHRVKL